MQTHALKVAKFTPIDSSKLPYQLVELPRLSIFYEAAFNK